ncbi:hypothetical protein COCSUDRAFT_61816 [Coccomyxa subellipsoidea C-169]|uniref:Uncharacterized protein n=1 Tax=Coccomyxa subellipsoidea (strain C-169) TaxID=574566 RepID=I0Z172_COCSC|nr:hypothetical protein COCSUDRAFT_61816 [Coccomyxa subellipsoidea C-169]EIE24391.1 hypothetical protein COCSUDRAFT_61816 [Coccomyxa subellipsoidea C-169]|eukprot:XP_005648935.1 hypothetical protein COCSUDRAFT_61816 [Coccomyxa subellipsoidea C-169]
MQAVTSTLSPHSVIQDCLSSLRKADVDSFEEHFPVNRVKLGPGERQVVLVGGKPCIEDGPLSHFVDVLDAGARRVLPAHLLRRCQVLSSLQLGHGTFVQRTAITARAGEEAVLIWTLTQQDGRWCVQSIKRDDSCDYPLPTRPHPRASPESIILAQMAALQRANLHDACKYMLFPGARPGSQLPKLMHSFMQGPSQLLINHTEAKLGMASLGSLQRMTQEAEVLPLPDIALEHSDKAHKFLWHMCMRGSGCWMVQSIEAVVT